MKATTINEVLERVAKVRPDAYDDDLKASWIMELEGKVRAEIFGRHIPCRCCPWLPEEVKVYPEDGDKPLLITAPHERVYDLYVLAQIDFFNREYDNYNNSTLAFNNALDEWRQSFHRQHIPCGTPLRNVF